MPASGSALYYAEDFLGSSRVIVQSTGTTCYDGDFTPFGAERAYQNACPQNYKFEGKERDTETQNDDFGAREYAWRFGRWLSADWSAVPTPVPYANLTNPQTLNLYSMVADDPESFADLDGHWITPAWWQHQANQGNSAGQAQSQATQKKDQEKAQKQTPVDAAAVDAEHAAYAKKDTLKKEYGGVIYSKNGTVSHTSPKHRHAEGRKDSEATVTNPNDRPKGTRLEAMYHSHSAATYRSNEFSQDDLNNAYDLSVHEGRPIPSYIGDANGGVYRYTPDTSQSSPTSDAEGRASGQVVTIVPPHD